MGDIPSDSGNSRKPPMSLGGKIGATIIFSIFFAMGAGFTFFIAREAYRNTIVYSWHTTDCLITRSAIQEIKNPDEYDYQFNVAYQYNGPAAAHDNPEADYQYHGTVVAPDYRAAHDYHAAQKLLDAYPQGSHAQCLVNPHDPSQAVLRGSGVWFALFIFIPLIFVAIGLAGMIAMWWTPRKAAAADVAPAAKARRSARGGMVLGGLFVVFGGCFLVFKTVPDVTHIQQSQSWPTTRCVIAHSGVRIHEGKSTTYSIDVLFRYEWSGRKYASSRYDFSTSSDGGYDSKEQVVRKIPAKSKTVCYVNPTDPGIAVLHRDGDVILETIVPLAFGGVGLLVMLLSRRAVRRSAAAAASPIHAGVRGIADPLAAARGAVDLKPRATPMATFIGLLIFTLFWNGIISIFIVVAGKQWFRPGHTDLCSSLFLIPFVLVGLLMLVLTIRAFLALFNPTVSINLNPGAVLPGHVIQMKWRFDGRYDRLDRLHIEALCQRQFTTGSGKNSSTSTTELLKIPIFETVKSMEIASGKASFTIPPGVKPSLEIGQDKIMWSVRVKGHIQHWPAVDESFAFQVLPGPEGAVQESSV